MKIANLVLHAMMAVAIMIIFATTHTGALQAQDIIITMKADNICAREDVMEMEIAIMLLIVNTAEMIHAMIQEMIFLSRIILLIMRAV
jgi:hypothetical protein